MTAFLSWIDAAPGQAPEALAADRPLPWGALAVRFLLPRYWADGGAEPLLALFLADESGWASCSVLADGESIRQALTAMPSRPALEAWLEAEGIGRFARGRPLRLMPVHIPKPWGEEIWFTGIEQRGVSQVCPPVGRPIPLPWLLAALPGYLLGHQAGTAPVLLKILAPWPEPGLGELYLELHEEKCEVYIITGIDAGAWPDGVGAIRFGIDPATRAGYADDAALRTAFAEAAADCERHRQEVDAWLDRRRLEAGLPLDVPASTAWLREQFRGMPAAWQQREVVLKARLDAFTRLLPLRVGDVVRVPTLLPHSLQHGVRAIEFQTPVYERKILAFGQKVLTQAHWDSREGAALMRLDAPALEPLPVLAEQADWQRQQVARFEDFGVDRIRVSGRIEKPAGHYCLLMALTGRLQAGGQALPAETAWLLPAAASLSLQSADEGETAVFLEAFPLAVG